MVQWVENPPAVAQATAEVQVPSLVQWVKDPALPQLWRRSQLRLRFCPSQGDYAMRVAQTNKQTNMEML